MKQVGFMGQFGFTFLIILTEALAFFAIGLFIGGILL